MRAIIVDDEPLAIERFCRISKNIEQLTIVGKFEETGQALEFAEKEKVDLAILDIEMPEIGGIKLGKELQKLNPGIVLIFVTGYEQYALKAFGIHAAAYLLKPYSLEEVQYAVQTAELLSQRKQHDVFVRTFGSFDVFVDGQPVFFKSSKAKELLALLIDAKGSTVTSGFAISMLWEDKPFDENSQSLYYKAAKSLEKTLKEWEIENIVIKTRYERCINRKEFRCDYYQLLEGKEDTVKAFGGEYMSQYAWAEETLAGIYKYLD